MIRQILGRIKTGIKTATGLKYNAFDLLRADHMRVEKLAIELRLTRNVKKRKHLLKQIRSILDRHMRIEEEVLYPACARLPGMRKLMSHSHSEHQLIKNALKDLAVMEPSSKRYSELVTKSIKELEHHVYTEENEVFAGASRHMSRREFNLLNREILRANSEEIRRRRGALEIRRRLGRAA